MNFRRLTTSPINYWGSFASDTLAAIGLLAAGFATTTRPLAAIAALALGIATYSFYEYAFHRWLYHATAVRDLHALHHRDPRAPIGAPFFFTLVVAASAFYLAHLVIDRPLAAVLAGAILATHVYQGAVHHLLHHGRASVLRRLQHHHNLHHRRSDTNFGVSTMMWDRVFRTHTR